MTMPPTPEARAEELAVIVREFIVQEVGEDLGELMTIQAEGPAKAHVVGTIDLSGKPWRDDPAVPVGPSDRAAAVQEYYESPEWQVARALCQNAGDRTSRAVAEEALGTGFRAGWDARPVGPSRDEWGRDLDRVEQLRAAISEAWDSLADDCDQAKQGPDAANYTHEQFIDGLAHYLADALQVSVGPSVEDREAQLADVLMEHMMHRSLERVMCSCGKQWKNVDPRGAAEHVADAVLAAGFARPSIVATPEQVEDRWGALLYEWRSAKSYEQAVQMQLEEWHANYHDALGNMMGRDDCGWEGCGFFDSATFVLAALGVPVTKEGDV